MKKSVSVFIAAVIALFAAAACVLAACADDGTVTDYGVVTDTSYGLCVFVAGDSTILLPSCDNITKVSGDAVEGNYSLKEGDLICLTFDRDTYATYSTLPADFATSPASIVCYAEGLKMEFGADGGSYLITVPADKTGAAAAGGTLTVTADGAAFTVEVTAVADGKVTLCMTSDEAKTFLKEYNYLTIS